jgi:hypothetical protein
MDQLYMTRNQDVTRAKENGLQMVATAVEEYGERGRDQGLFPVSEKQTTTGNPSIPRVYIYGNGTWEIKIILP